MSVFRNGDSGAVHSRQARQERSDAATAQDKRDGSMTHDNKTTVRELQQRHYKR
jgi:hypothetical protein